MALLSVVAGFIDIKVTVFSSRSTNSPIIASGIDSGLLFLSFSYRIFFYPENFMVKLKRSQHPCLSRVMRISGG